MTSRVSTQKRKSSTLAVGVIGVALVAALVAAFGGGVAWIVSVVGDGMEESCADHCGAIGMEKVTLTQFGCVCKNPRTGKRQVFPLESAHTYPQTVEVDP